MTDACLVEKCPGAGKCHGHMTWCADCGAVDSTCDSRLRGEQCDAHPVPPDMAAIRVIVAVAERKIEQAETDLRAGLHDLQKAHYLMQQRRRYDRQLAAEEERPA